MDQTKLAKIKFTLLALCPYGNTSGYLSGHGKREVRRQILEAITGKKQTIASSSIEVFENKLYELAGIDRSNYTLRNAEKMLFDWMKS